MFARGYTWINPLGPTRTRPSTLSVPQEPVHVPSSSSFSPRLWERLWLLLLVVLAWEHISFLARWRIYDSLLGSPQVEGSQHPCRVFLFRQALLVKPGGQISPRFEQMAPPDLHTLWWGILTYVRGCWQAAKGEASQVTGDTPSPLSPVRVSASMTHQWGATKESEWVENKGR